jgi:predicted RecA/RadA family phage recombinase
MSKNYIQPGKVQTFVAPSGGVVSGQGYVHGGLVVVAEETVPEGLPYEGNLEGVFEMTKVTTDVMTTLGARIHWDNTNKRWSTTATAGFFQAGTVVKAAGNGVTTVHVRLDGHGVTVNP